MNSQAAAQTPPPEADLIRRAREARNLSPETAAAQMKIKFSGSRWRQIEAGYRKDLRRQVIAKDPVLAHMAHAVGVTPGRLEEAGRSEAAAVLREIQAAELTSGQVPHPEHAPPSRSLPHPLDELEPWRQQTILEMVAKLPPERRGPALRRLAERVEAGELPPAAQEEEPGPPQQPRRTG